MKKKGMAEKKKKILHMVIAMLLGYGHSNAFAGLQGLQNMIQID